MGGKGGRVAQNCFRYGFHSPLKSLLLLVLFLVVGAVAVGLEFGSDRGATQPAAMHRCWVYWRFASTDLRAPMNLGFHSSSRLLEFRSLYMGPKFVPCFGSVGWAAARFSISSF